ncbi:hypothetical protein [Aquimarina muelleri]|uniref:Uncharacterized protein n=1 Tax=Aquimarina muelleri TaxID=279356 RepID=A0A918JYQ1_9FLAO|nr:hypothetical protein [Aquimarina muelleri]MCX2763683.1 hypothetical protein [Aquimarina muelleri]GGX30311.1 hypothetical protein GCM10007384_34280 [Aquimarina muelleri]
MSKLHFYEKSSKVADGDGTLNNAGFDAKITWGSVEKGHTYEVKQGQKPSGDSYPCIAGGTKNDTAKFGPK